MSNTDIARKFSVSNSASASITSENLSNELSPMWSLAWEGENHHSTEGVQVPQYSWRKKSTAINCNEVTEAERTPSPILEKNNLNSRDLLRKKLELLQQIALEHSRLAGLMRDELDLTGIEPDGYAESMKAYDKAIDDFDCFQILMDSMVIAVSQEPEVNSETEKRISHQETSYALSPRMLRKITYGSLQNFVQAQEQESKSSAEVIDLTKDNPLKDSQQRNRARSTPREVYPPVIPRSATISAGSTATTFRPRLLVSSESSEKAPNHPPAASRHVLQRFFSLKSLSESLPIITSRPPSGVTQRSIDADDDFGSEVMSPHTPVQTRRAISRMDPKKLDELINWKNMEIATVQNILRANMKKAKDSVICKKSRRAYRGCAQENQKTLLRLYRENEELKEARHMALPSRSQSVGRFETSHPQLPPMINALSPPLLPHPENRYALQSHQNGSLSIGGDAISDTSSFHADEQSSVSSHSSAKQTHHSELTISCQSSGSSRTDNSVPSVRKDNPSPVLSSKSHYNHTQDVSSDDQSLNPLNNGHSPISSIDCLQYLFPDQMNQQTMRSYGRPNYSRYGSVKFGHANRPEEELNQLPRFCSTQDSHFKPIFGNSGYNSNPPLQSKPQNRLVQYTSSATRYLPTPPVRTSPTHFRINTSNFPRDVRLISELEQLTTHPNQHLTSSEVTPTSSSRPRYTLADKLNLCTTDSTNSTSFH
ncbi:hypothetical protein Aperf_G00000026272 [Anoplocephala perfoliata]